MTESIKKISFVLFTSLVLVVCFPQKTHAANGTYKVAIFGDSMVDTMGTGLPYLAKYLGAKYPQYKIEYYNYGIGGQNLTTAIGRFNNAYSYMDRNYPSICDLRPDVLILGSFAYNPESPYNRDSHWVNMARLYDMSKNCAHKAYILSEIGPLKNGFGQGPGGVNWGADVSAQQANKIKELLENAVSIAKNPGYLGINVYGLTKNGEGFGSKRFVSTHDGIHPSIAGHNFTAKIIARTISF